MKLFKEIVHHIIQIPGWHTKRHLVSIESDDWGSIRMPSLDVYRDLLSKGIRADKCLFSRYDSLESKEDLLRLFEILNSVRDSKSNPAIITANSVVANPDFDLIEKNSFQKYFYEPVNETYNRYYGNNDIQTIMNQGMSNGLWRPQFHGREHLNIVKWMKQLQAKDPLTIYCFDKKHFSLTKDASDKVKIRYMDSFNNDDTDSLEIEK